MKVLVSLSIESGSTHGCVSGTGQKPLVKTCTLSSGDDDDDDSDDDDDEENDEDEDEDDDDDEEEEEAADCWEGESGA